MKVILILSLAIILSHFSRAQSFAINTDGSIANNSAILDVKSSSKGILIPRMDSTQRANILLPANGLLVYQTNKDSGFYSYDGSVWQLLINAGNNLWKKSGTHIYNTNTGNVGIGIINPLARLHVLDSSVLFSGTGDVPGVAGPVPISGAGRRMMWYANKAAFRTGYVNAAQWDAGNIGNYSAAFGNGTTASNTSSAAFGSFNIASGVASFVAGINSKALGSYSFALGNSVTASGFSSLATGSGNIASADYSTAMGLFTYASGGASTAMGYGTIVRSIACLSAGQFNDTSSTNHLFEIGNGTAHDARNNALTVLLNGTVLMSGNVGIGTNNPTKKTEIIGPSSAIPVTLVIGNRGGFGPAAMEFVSDYDQANQWRPGYIRSNDLGSYTGALEFYTNGTGVGNYYTSVKGLEVRNGITYTASGTVSSWSDTRLKKDVQPFTNGLDIINQINPVSFYYNQQSPFQTEKMQIGILAQELEKVAPYMVDKNVTKDFEDLRSVNNQAYTFLLINAVKDQQQQIKELKEQLDEQRKLIGELLKK